MMKAFAVVRMEKEDEIVEKLKSLQFNKPDFDYLREKATEASQENEILEQNMREVQKITEDTLIQRFTV